MLNLTSHLSGRHFLAVPGPTNIPDRILHAISRPTIDHRGPEFAKMTLKILTEIKPIFQTTEPVIIYASSGTGGSEAALVNTLSFGDHVLMFETGYFATVWKNIALKYGLNVDFVPGDWRSGVDPEIVYAKLADDKDHKIKAVAVVHNETSTGVTSSIPKIRSAIDKANHPALFLVDAISSIAATDYQHDEWGVDVTVCGSQKGLMVPPGLSFNAISKKAQAASKVATLPKNYWDWGVILASNVGGFFPWTIATNLLYGLHESIQMLHEEGLNVVFKRHKRHAEATREAARAWGLEILCKKPEEYSNALTALIIPEPHNANEFRKLILENYNLSLGMGLGKLAGKVFRIGHLGYFNDLMLCGTLSGVEMGLKKSNIAIQNRGIVAAIDYLMKNEVFYGN